MAEKEKKMAPTIEAVNRFDELEIEINRLRESGSDDDWKKCMSLIEEQENLKDTYDWTDIIFEENGKKGLKNVKGEVIVPAEYDDFMVLEPYYYYSLGIGAKKGNYVGLVARDGKGTPRTDFEFFYIERVFGTPFYMVMKEEDKKHFALMIAGTVYTPYEIQECDVPCDGCMILYADGKQGLLAIDQGLIYVKPEYDEVIDNGIGDDFTFIKDGKPGRVTVEGRFVSDEEYKQLSEDEQDELDDTGYLGSID